MTGNTTAKFNKGFLEFAGEPVFQGAGNIEANATQVNVTTETALVSQALPAGILDNVGKQFKIKIAGTISSDGTDDTTFTLRFGSTDILEITTVSLPDEDDKAFELEFQGRVHTTGASGKLVANGKFSTEMTGIANIMKATAVAGVSVDLTAESSLNITSDWDTSSADSEVCVTSAIFEFFN